MKRTGLVALSGMIAALSVACMFCTNLFPYATYALPAISGMLLAVIVIEGGKRWALVVYFAVAVLSLLFSTDLEAKLLFVTFFGYYPILKALYESLRRPIFSWAIKFATFNAAVIATYWFSILLKILPDDFEMFGVNLPLVFLLMGNLVFLLYDIAMSRMITMYAVRFHGRVQKYLKLK